jgi:hypothetical protein
MSTPTNANPYDARVMVEIVVEGVPQRIHVWTRHGNTYVTFPEAMDEARAVGVMKAGLDLIKGIDVARLMKEKPKTVKGRAKRLIDTEGENDE